MKKLGLIGYPLTHSFSPKFFERKFKELGLTDWNYQLYPLDQIEDVDSFLSKKFIGFNVTIPYKEAIIPYLDRIENGAFEIGAVNTVKNEDGIWTGYNTDVYGFKKSLLDLIGNKTIDAALILGSGGASKAVKFVLKEMEIPFKVVSRNASKGISYESVGDHLEDHHLIINTTPLGMSPKVEQAPDIPYEQLTDKYFLFDLIYNPEKTLFLQRGEQQGCAIKNGMDMLTLQAELAWTIWNQQ